MASTTSSELSSVPRTPPPRQNSPSATTCPTCPRSGSEGIFTPWAARPNEFATLRRERGRFRGASCRLRDDEIDAGMTLTPVSALYKHRANARAIATANANSAPHEPDDDDWEITDESQAHSPSPARSANSTPVPPPPKASDWDYVSASACHSSVHPSKQIDGGPAS